MSSTGGFLLGFGALLQSANGVDAQVYRLMEAEWRDAALSGMMPMMGNAAHLLEMLRANARRQ